MVESQSTRTLAPLFTWRSAICESKLPPSTRHVLLALSLYMNQRGGSAYPGSARLARDTGLHQTTVKRALSDAVKSGYLVVLQKGGSPPGGVRLATEYVAADPSLHDRGHQATGSPVLTDRGSDAHRPVAPDPPISSLNSSENSRGVASKFNDPPPLTDEQKTAAKRRAREALTSRGWGGAE